MISRTLLVAALAVAGLASNAHAATLTSGSEWWKPAKNARVARTELAATSVGHSVYLLGGIPKGQTQPIGSLERYDVDTGRAAMLRSLPVGLQHIGLVQYAGDLLAVGGDTGDGAGTADVYRYTRKRNSWAKITSLPGGPRTGAAVGVDGDRLLVAGGSRGADVVGALEIYDLKRGRWSNGPSLPTPRAHTAGLVLFGRFYVVGGTDATGQNVPTLERFSGGRWQKLANMPRVQWGFGLARAAGRLAVVGGIGAGGQVLGAGGLAPQVELFDPSRGRWSSLPGLRTARHHLAAVAVGARLFAFGGTTELLAPAATSAVERLELPHPTRTEELIPFKISIRGARVSEANGKVTTAGELRSKQLGDGGIVSHGTATPETTRATWSLLTPEGVIYCRVLLVTHLSSAGVALDGIGTITGGRGRYKGAKGWFAADETLSADFQHATVELEGTVIRPR